MKLNRNKKIVEEEILGVSSYFCHFQEGGGSLKQTFILGKMSIWEGGSGDLFNYTYFAHENAQIYVHTKKIFAKSTLELSYA